MLRPRRNTDPHDCISLYHELPAREFLAWQPTESVLCCVEPTSSELLNLVKIVRTATGLPLKECHVRAKSRLNFLVSPTHWNDFVVSMATLPVQWTWYDPPFVEAEIEYPGATIACRCEKCGHEFHVENPYPPATAY
ncbi:MAG: hypothetical protein WC505_05615 [Patescibacteria group bacterium]